MQLQNLPSPGNSEKINEDRATAAILTGGGADGVPALALRHWRPDGSPAEPVFITWLLGVGRFCLTVKYGRYSLRGSDWQVDAWSGLRGTPSPLDQAQDEALRVSEALQRRLIRRVPVSPALVLFDMEGDRCIERLARRRRIPLLWNLERYTGCWPARRRVTAAANQWTGPRPWRRYPHWSGIHPPPASEHPALGGCVTNPQRDTICAASSCRKKRMGLPVLLQPAHCGTLRQ